MKNWENKEMDIRTNAITYTMKRRDTMRMVMTKVLRQNKIDVFVNPVNPTLQGKIGGAAAAAKAAAAVRLRLRRDAGHSRGVRAGGFADSVHDRVQAQRDGKKYEGEESTTPTKLGGIGLPYNIGFWAEPGQEATLMKVGAAYEAATHHRKPPPAFGPVKGEPVARQLTTAR